MSCTNFPCSKPREVVPAVNYIRQEEVSQRLTKDAERFPDFATGSQRLHLGKLSTSCYILEHQGVSLQDCPVQVQKYHGRNTEKWLELLELNLCPWRGPYCPVLPKLSLHHGGKLRPLLESLQTDWKQPEVQAESTISLGQVH